MALVVRDVMTTAPVALPGDATVVDAAREMRDHDIGDVLVVEEEQVRGLVTDRDIVVRGIAGGEFPTLREVCSEDLLGIGPEDELTEAVRLMRARAVRRLPVVDDNEVIGMVAIGDLAIMQDPSSALADISASRGNE